MPGRIPDLRIIGVLLRAYTRTLKSKLPQQILTSVEESETELKTFWMPDVSMF